IAAELEAAAELHETLECGRIALQRVHLAGALLRHDPREAAARADDEEVVLGAAEHLEPGLAEDVLAVGGGGRFARAREAEVAPAAATLRQIRPCSTRATRPSMRPRGISSSSSGATAMPNARAPRYA